MSLKWALTLYLHLMKDRIKQIMESQHMTQQAFSQFTGISSSVLSGIFTGRTKPTLNQVEAIHRKIPNINLYWLLSGVGSMYNTETQTAGEAVAVPSPTPQEEAPLVENKTVDGGIAGLAVKGYNKNAGQSEMKKTDISKRRVTEIRVFYDDNTYESFVPKNS